MKNIEKTHMCCTKWNLKFYYHPYFTSFSLEFCIMYYDMSSLVCLARIKDFLYFCEDSLLNVHL